LEEEEYDNQDLEENDGYQVNVSEVYESKLNIEGNTYQSYGLRSSDVISATPEFL